jgi:hypothetical protein
MRIERECVGANEISRMGEERVLKGEEVKNIYILKTA